MFWLFVAVAALGVIDVGHLFFEQRNLQRTADMAAIAGSQLIAGSCANAETAASNNATTNGFDANAAGASIEVTCGRWDISANAAPDYFSTAGAPQNAVLVQLTQSVPYFFMGPSRTLTVVATAQATNVDAFTLGSGLAQLDTQQSTLLNGIVGGLLGTQVALSAVDYQGLANARVSLQDLMVQLGATTVSQLLTTSVTYQQLTVAMVNALTANGDTADAALLQALSVAIPGNQSFTIGDGGTSSPGLLALALADPQSAVNATLSPLDAVLVAAQISRSTAQGSSNAPPIINVDASTSLVGLAPTGLSLQVLVPPTLAVGEGPDANGNARTTARTAQISATVTLSPGLLSTGLNLNLGLVSLQALNSPVVLNVSALKAQAQLTSVDCDTTKTDSSVQIEVEPQVASVCLGTGVGATCGGPINIASVMAGPLVVAQVALGSSSTGGVSISMGTNQVQTVSFNGVTGTAADGADTQTVNSNAVGSDLTTLTGSLLTAVPTALQVNLLGGTLSLSAITAAVVGPITQALTTTLTPVLGSLDDVFIPLLGALGAQVGTATVHHDSLTCGAARIVS